MPFTLVPVEASRISLSDIRDVERERLKVTFSHGEKLYFRVDLRRGMSHPRLLLDDSEYARSGRSSNMEIRKEFSRTFYRKRVYRSRTRRLIDLIHGFVDSNFYVSFGKWTYERLLKELEIELFIGDDYRGTDLVKGHMLKLYFGTHESERLWEWTPFTMGDVESIESVVEQPVSLAHTAVV